MVQIAECIYREKGRWLEKYNEDDINDANLKKCIFEVVLIMY